MKACPEEMRRQNEEEEHLDAQKQASRPDPLEADYPHIIARLCLLEDSEVMRLSAEQRLQLRDLLRIAKGD